MYGNLWGIVNHRTVLGSKDKKTLLINTCVNNGCEKMVDND